jgi:hypothetical protein
VFTRPAKILRPSLAVPPRPGLAPRSSSHLPGLWVTRHQRGFTHVRPSGLPLACAPGWNGTRFGFFPELRTPQLPATHVRVGTGLEHWPGVTSPASPVLQSANSLAACDLVSHILGPVISREQHALSRPRCQSHRAACGRAISDLINECSRHSGGHDIPAAIYSPGHRAGARSLVRASRRSPGARSAHLPAATGPESAGWLAR